MEGQVPVTRYTYAGLAMVTMATLMYEILLTRIFSVTIWYHYAFLVISLALFGLTIGALIVYLRPHVFTLQRAKDHLALSSLAFAVSLVVTFLIHLGIPVEIDPSPGGLAALALTYLVVSVPFVFSGICVCIALTRFPDRVSRLYAADLIGAATGCLAVVYVLDLTDGPTAVIASGLLAALGALCFATEASRRRLLFGSLACVLVLAAATAVQGILSAEGRPPLRLTWSKQGPARGALLYEKWNSFSRITVNGVLDLRTPPAGWGLSSFCRQGVLVRQLWLFIDAAAGTVITAYDGDARKIEHLKCDVTNLAHYLRQDAEVLVIGAGGGRDVLSALCLCQAPTGSPRREDNDLFRYYEIAGTAHTTVHEDIEILPAGVLGPTPLFLEEACLHPINSLADGPVFGSYMYNAMWQNMQDTVRDGTEAPHGELIERDSDGDIVRDEFGNAVGGISPTQIQVPVATYGARNEPNPANLPGPLILLGNLFCVLSGTVEPFDDATLNELYPRRGDCVGLVNAAAAELKADGFLLPLDLQKVLQAAAVKHLGCGLGFELVLVLPLLMWLKRGRGA